MGDIKSKYGSSGQAITITLNSLADDTLVLSNEISNTTDLFFDAGVQVQIKTGAAGVDSNGYIVVYAIGSSNNGSDYPDSANYELTPIGRFNANVNDTEFTSNVMKAAVGFNGQLPEKWKICVKNKTGVALASSGNSAWYQGNLAQG